MKHKSEIYKLHHIIDVMPGGPWYEVMQVEIEGLVEARCSGQDDWLEAAMAIEAAYLRQHENDNYLVIWPDHVLSPQFDSDASYQLVQFQRA